MAPRVEVIREPGVAATPRILVQVREDEPTWAMTIEEAWRWLEVEEIMPAYACIAGSQDHCECLTCQIYDALQGLA